MNALINFECFGQQHGRRAFIGGGFGQATAIGSARFGAGMAAKLGEQRPLSNLVAGLQPAARADYLDHPYLPSGAGGHPTA